LPLISAYFRLAEKTFFCESGKSQLSAESCHKGDGLRLLPSPSVAIRRFVAKKFLFFFWRFQAGRWDSTPYRVAGWGRLRNV
jgi:hypothetical protein